MPILSSLGALKNFNVKAYSGTGNISYFSGASTNFYTASSDGTYIYITGKDTGLGIYTFRVTNTGVLDRQYQSLNSGYDVKNTVLHYGALYIFGSTISTTPDRSQVYLYSNPNTSSTINSIGADIISMYITKIVGDPSTYNRFYGSYEPNATSSAVFFKATYSGTFGSGGFFSIWSKQIVGLSIPFTYTCLASPVTNTVFYSVLGSTGGTIGYNFLFDSSGNLLYQTQITAIVGAGTENIWIKKAVYDSSGNLYCLCQSLDQNTYIVKLDSTLSVLWCKQYTRSGTTWNPGGLFVDSNYVYITDIVLDGISPQILVAKLDKTLLDGSTYPVVWANNIQLPSGYLVDENGIFVIGDRLCLVTNGVGNPSAILSLPIDGNIPYRGSFTVPFSFTITRSNISFINTTASTSDPGFSITTGPAWTTAQRTPSTTTFSLTWNNVSFGS